MEARMRSKESIVQTSKIIAFAMIGATLIFIGIAFFIAKNVAGDGDENLISLILAAVGIPEMVMFFLTPSLITDETLKQLRSSESSPKSRELDAYQRLMVQTIIRFALLEGVCLINTIAYILEQNWWSLAIAGTFLLFMVTNIPTTTRFKHYAETAETF